MNPNNIKILRNILAVVIGVFIGGIFNMFIVMKGSLPEGVTMETLSTSIHLFEAKHFVYPILGHAIGTLAGAILAGLIAASHKMRFAMAIGVFYFFGGIANIIMLHFPLIPALIDLSIAYLPMGWLGGKIAMIFTKESKTDTNIEDSFHRDNH